MSSSQQDKQCISNNKLEHAYHFSNVAWPSSHMTVYVLQTGRGHNKAACPQGARFHCGGGCCVFLIALYDHGVYTTLRVKRVQLLTRL